MNRRKFIIMSFSAVALSALPNNLHALNYRTTHPEAWSAHSVEKAIHAMYNSNELIESGVVLKTPDVAANGGSVPINVSSDIKAKSVAIFQDANPEAAVIVFKTNEHTIIDYDIKIKMKSQGTITAVVEGEDGLLYAAKKILNVALGGCDP
jgi:sulfur-oxidizing protein SoxY